MQHGEEDGALDREFEAASGEQFMQNRAAAGVTPQALEQQRRTDALAGGTWRLGLVEQGEDHRALCEARGGSRQAVEVSVAFDLLLTTEITNDALFGLAILTDGLDQVDVGVRTDALFADEHGPSIRDGADSSSAKES